MDSERDAHLRRLLVATAEVATTARPRPARVLAAGLAAFVLAGALTGGAVAVASTAHDTGEVGLANYATSALGTGGTLVGDPTSFSGHGRTELDIPPAPHDGDRLLIVTRCSEVVTLTARLDDDVLLDGDCSGYGSAVRSVSRTGHTLTAWAPGGQSYTVFASWFKDMPTPVASDQQKYEMSDGVVTREEYVSSYSRYAGCMAEAGFPLPPVDVNTNVILSTAVSGTAASTFVADERCYRREFWDVDAAWQSAHP